MVPSTHKPALRLVLSSFPCVGVAVGATTVSATVVLANATKVVVNDELAAANPALADLWFALKGAGGGNFGVVTSMTIKLHRVTGGSPLSLLLHSLH